MGNEQGGEFDPSKDGGKEPNHNPGNNTSCDDDIMRKPSKKRAQEKKTQVESKETNFGSSKGDEAKEATNIVPKDYLQDQMNQYQNAMSQMQQQQQQQSPLAQMLGNSMAQMFSGGALQMMEIVDEDGNKKNVLVVDKSKLNQNQNQKLDCGGPSTDVPGKCECGFKHKRQKDAKLVDHIITMRTPKGNFEIGFNHGDDPIEVSEEVGVDTGLVYESEQLYQQMVASVVDAVIRLNDRDDMIEKNGGSSSQRDVNNQNSSITDYSKAPNGTRTKTRSSYCPCGYKHMFAGREVDFTHGFPGYGDRFVFGYNLGEKPENVLEEFYSHYQVVKNESLSRYVHMAVSKNNKRHGFNCRVIAEDYTVLRQHKGILLCNGSENASKFIDMIIKNYQESAHEKLSDSEISILTSLANMIGIDFKSFPNKELSPLSLPLVEKILRKTPNEKLWPSIDLLRFLITHPIVLEYCFANDTLFKSVIQRCCQEGSDPASHMMALRMIANYTSNDRGAALFRRNDMILELLDHITISITDETNKHYTQSLQANIIILHNLSPFFKKKSTPEAQQAIGLLTLILTKPELNEVDGFNALMALGNMLFSNEQLLKENYQLSHETQFLDQWRLPPKNTNRILSLLKDIDRILLS